MNYSKKILLLLFFASLSAKTIRAMEDSIKSIKKQITELDDSSIQKKAGYCAGTALLATIMLKKAFRSRPGLDFCNKIGIDGNVPSLFNIGLIVFPAFSAFGFSSNTPIGVGPNEFSNLSKPCVFVGMTCFFADNLVAKRKINFGAGVFLVGSSCFFSTLLKRQQEKDSSDLKN